MEQLCTSEISIMCEEILTRGITTDTFEMNAFNHKCMLSNNSVNIVVFSDDDEYHYIIFDSDMGILSYNDSFESLVIAKDYAIDEADNKF